jgi:hypothetical protein
MTLAFGVANDGNHLMPTFNKVTAGDFNHQFSSIHPLLQIRLQLNV